MISVLCLWLTYIHSAKIIHEYQHIRRRFVALSKMFKSLTISLRVLVDLFTALFSSCQNHEQLVVDNTT